MSASVHSIRPGAAALARSDDPAGLGRSQPCQCGHPRADAERGRAHPGAGRPPDRRRRQADAADADPRLRAAARLPGRAPPQARRRGRVHPHRDLAPRRRRRRLGPEARQAHRQHHLGQSGQRPGRRLPLLAKLRADGRGRQLASPQDPLASLGGDRRGRGRPAHRPAPDRHRRGPLSGDHPAPRPPLCSPPPAGSPRSSPSATTRPSRRSIATAAISESPSSWSTTRSTIRRTPERWARASATISATAR